MARICFTTADGESLWVEADEGRSVMEAALETGVPAIEGQCGGFLNCATCHVFIEDQWQERVPEISGGESELLEGTAEPARPNSRLACQIIITSELDGLQVHLPERQS